MAGNTKVASREDRGGIETLIVETALYNPKAFQWYQGVISALKEVFAWFVKPHQSPVRILRAAAGVGKSWFLLHLWHLFVGEAELPAKVDESDNLPSSLEKIRSRYDTFWLIAVAPVPIEGDFEEKKKYAFRKRPKGVLWVSKEHPEKDPNWLDGLTRFLAKEFGLWVSGGTENEVLFIQNLTKVLRERERPPVLMVDGLDELSDDTLAQFERLVLVPFLAAGVPLLLSLRAGRDPIWRRDELRRAGEIPLGKPGEEEVSKFIEGLSEEDRKRIITYTARVPFLLDAAAQCKTKYFGQKSWSQIWQDDEVLQAWRRCLKWSWLRRAFGPLLKVTNGEEVLEWETYHGEREQVPVSAWLKVLEKVVEKVEARKFEPAEMAFPEIRDPWSVVHLLQERGLLRWTRSQAWVLDEGMVAVFQKDEAAKRDQTTADEASSHREVQNSKGMKRANSHQSTPAPGYVFAAGAGQ